MQNSWIDLNGNAQEILAFFTGWIGIAREAVYAAANLRAALYHLASLRLKPRRRVISLSDGRGAVKKPVTFLATDYPSLAVFGDHAHVTVINIQSGK